MDAPLTLRHAYQHALWAFVDRGERDPLAQALTSVAESVHLSPAMRRLGLLGHMILTDLPAHAPIADWARWYTRIDRLLDMHEDATLTPNQRDQHAQQLAEQLLHQRLFNALSPDLLMPSPAAVEASRAPHPTLLAPVSTSTEGVVLVLGMDDHTGCALPPKAISAIIATDRLAALTDQDKRHDADDEAPMSDGNGNGEAVISPIGTIIWDEQRTPVVALAPIDAGRLAGCIVVVDTPKEVATGFANIGVYVDRWPTWQAPLGHPTLDRVALARAINASGYFLSCCSK